MITIRVITSKTCKKCEYYKKVLEKFKVQYENYDADDPNNQKQLDEWRIVHMPVVQLVEDQKVLFQFPAGQIGITTLNDKKSKLEQNTTKEIITPNVTK